MSDQSRPLRRLGVYSLGFLWQPRLRRALASAGWRVEPGIRRCDAIGVWGRRGVARRGLAAARLTGANVLTIEDGFLRSVTPGPGQPVISLILDDLGVYYDCTRPSRLEAMIEAGSDRPDTDVLAALEALKAARLSKYNNGPAGERPNGHVLVIDQTAGDASIRWGGAGAEAFPRMLAAARAENPGAEILIRSHPETVLGRKAGHFSAGNAGGARLLTEPQNPWDLIEGARVVYTVSSQLGFEALLAGVPVRCFGTPFYAGWGATEDEPPRPDRRTATRSVQMLFASAYLDYPHYFNPWSGELSDFAESVRTLSFLREAQNRKRDGAVFVGARLWKRKALAGFFDVPGRPTRFEDRAEPAQALASSEGRNLIVWAGKETEALQLAAPPCLWRAEDGFLRSVGLGAALTPPLSLALDDLGIYYDPSRESRLERMIADAPEDSASTTRARLLRDGIVALGLTKYNLSGAEPPTPPAGRRVILVPGQVEDDASIRLGAGEIRTNKALLAETRARSPDAYLIYKPHPDVEAGLRPGACDAAEWADHVAVAASAPALLAVADEVWTMTSLMGFEALLRGKRVVTFGAPFYAGWGLTVDHGSPPERRLARPTLDGLVHAALIDYPIYRDPISGLPAPPEVIVRRLAEGVSPRGPANRLLAKAQGALASYAWLWR